MRKKTIAILFTVGMILCALALIAKVPTNGWLAQCKGTSVCASPSPSVILAIVLTVLFGIASSVLLVIAHIGMLIKQAKRQQWGWFVCTILFSWITMLIYLIRVPEVDQSTMVDYPARPQYEPYAPGLQQYPPQSERSMQQPQE